MKDIQQSFVVGSLDAMTKFGQTQISTQMSEYLEKTKALATDAGRTTQSAAQVLKGLNYTIPKKDPASDVQSTSKDYDSTKEDNDVKAKVEIDNEGFKILQGNARIISHILDRELDLSGLHMDTVKIRYELKPYGLTENEWRCFLIHHKNSECKEITLAQVARKLVMELELKITEFELICDRDKNPLEQQALKAQKLYLKLIKKDRYKSASSESDNKCQNRRASRNSSRESVAKMDRELSMSRQREQELKASLCFDSQ